MSLTKHVRQRSLTDEFSMLIRRRPRPYSLSSDDGLELESLLSKGSTAVIKALPGPKPKPRKSAALRPQSKRRRISLTIQKGIRKISASISFEAFPLLDAAPKATTMKPPKARKHRRPRGTRRRKVSLFLHRGYKLFMRRGFGVPLMAFSFAGVS